MGMTRSHAHDGRTRHRASEQLSPPKRVPAYSASRINTKGRTDERERDDVPQPTPLCFARTRVRCRRSIRAQGRYVAVAVLITLQRGAAIPSKNGCITALRLRRNHGPTASACSRHSTCRNATRPHCNGGFFCVAPPSAAQCNVTVNRA